MRGTKLLSSWYGEVRISKALLLLLVVCLPGDLFAQVGGGGPSTEQLLDELETRNAEFDSFGWPARGRYTVSPRFLEKYKGFNKKLLY